MQKEQSLCKKQIVLGLLTGLLCGLIISVGRFRGYSILSTGSQAPALGGSFFDAWTRFGNPTDRSVPLLEFLFQYPLSWAGFQGRSIGQRFYLTFTVGLCFWSVYRLSLMYTKRSLTAAIAAACGVMSLAVASDAADTSCMVLTTAVALLACAVLQWGERGVLSAWSAVLVSGVLSMMSNSPQGLAVFLLLSALITVVFVAGKKDARRRFRAYLVWWAILTVSSVWWVGTTVASLAGSSAQFTGPLHLRRGPVLIDPLTLQTVSHSQVSTFLARLIGGSAIALLCYCAFKTRGKVRLLVILVMSLRVVVPVVVSLSFSWAGSIFQLLHERKPLSFIPPVQTLFYAPLIVAAAAAVVIILGDSSSGYLAYRQHFARAAVYMLLFTALIGGGFVEKHHRVKLSQDWMSVLEKIDQDDDPGHVLYLSSTVSEYPGRQAGAAAKIMHGSMIEPGSLVYRDFDTVTASIRAGNMAQLSSALASMDVSMVLVDKREAEPIPGKVLPEQASRAIKAIGGSAVTVNDSLELWRVPQVYSPIKSPVYVTGESSPENYGVGLTKGEAISDSTSGTLLTSLWIAGERNSVVSAGIGGEAYIYPSSPMRYTLEKTADGAEMRADATVSVNGDGKDNYYSISLGQDVAAIKTKTGTYGFGDSFVLPASEEYAVLHGMGDVPADLSYRSCGEKAELASIDSMAGCTIVSIGGLDHTVAHIAVIRWQEGEIGYMCVNDHQENCRRQTAGRDGLAMAYISAGRDGRDVRIEAATGQVVRGISVTMTAVDVENVLAPASIEPIALGSITEGGAVYFRNVLKNVNLEMATDCSGNTGKRIVSGGKLLLEDFTKNPCTGFSLDDITPGSSVRVTIDIQSGDADACLYEHAVQSCIAETRGERGRVALDGALSGGDYEGLTLYIYASESASVISSINVTEYGSWGVYVRRDEGIGQPRKYTVTKSGAGDEYSVESGRPVIVMPRPGSKVVGGGSSLSQLDISGREAWLIKEPRTVFVVSPRGENKVWVLLSFVALYAVFCVWIVARRLYRRRKLSVVTQGVRKTLM